MATSGSQFLGPEPMDHEDSGAPTSELPLQESPSLGSDLPAHIENEALPVDQPLDPTQGTTSDNLVQLRSARSSPGVPTVSQVQATPYLAPGQQSVDQVLCSLHGKWRSYSNVIRDG